jgi:hypothetical protein
LNTMNMNIGLIHIRNIHIYSYRESATQYLTLCDKVIP